MYLGTLSIFEQTYPPSCVGVRDMPAVGVAELSGKQQHTPNESDLLRLYSQTDFKIVRRIKVIICKMSTLDV